MRGDIQKETRPDEEVTSAHLLPPDAFRPQEKGGSCESPARHCAAGAGCKILQLSSPQYCRTGDLWTCLLETVWLLKVGLESIFKKQPTRI